MASTVIAVVMGGLFTVLSSGQQTFLRGSNEVEALQTLRLATSRMTQEIRDAGSCPTYGTPAAAVQRGEQTMYAYDSASRTFTRREVGIDAAGVAIATGIASLTLTFQNAAGATVALPTTAATALMIRTVVVTVVGQPANQPTTFQTGRVQVAMTDTVRVRNRAL